MSDDPLQHGTRAESEGSGADDSFDALLRKAAYVSAPAPAGRSVLPAGQALVGGRLSIIRFLGEGGMGVVYEAFDAERKARVALKTLSRLDAAAVYRLKSEFRALADVTSENLVQLHELFADSDTWLFTMELVQGERFDTWVRPSGVLDETRLRATLPQLLTAIEAIHRAGKLHRDLKPSNVLVSREGRVVVLDFGLAVDPEPGGVGQTVADGSVSGTPAYMAPEQAAGEPATAASDLYALGVMLFEALSGQLPFAGRVHEMLVDKQRRAAPLLSSRAPAAPADLCALCDALLSRLPPERPTSATLRARFGAATDAAATRERPAIEPELLLGRERELAALHGAYAATLVGQAVVVLLTGESGTGKSALLARFAEELRGQSPSVLLTGRCYERERVPFKALDPLIDALSRHLRKLSQADAAAVLPREAFALARLFPVLDRVEVVARAPRKDLGDAQELRRRGFAALVELLARMRDRGPVVLCIDDLQWSDRDSAALLRFVLSQEEPVPLLLVLSHRSEGARENPLLEEVRGWVRDNARISTRELALGPLPSAAAEQLAAALLGGRASAPLSATIARDAECSAFLIGEIVRHVLAEGGAAPGPNALRDALAARIARLPAPARGVLELAAVAGWPLPIELLSAASGVGERAHTVIEVLCAQKLLRIRGHAVERRVECYHDRVRESVSGQLDEEAIRAHHASLLAELRGRDGVDPELLFAHAQGAGEHAVAAVAAMDAAERALTKLAFERAAELYERALELGTHSESRRRSLTISLGDAWTGAGAGRAAAAAYLKAAEGAPPPLGIELRRRAAERMFCSGEVDGGKALLYAVLRDLGMPPARGNHLSLLSALWQRARVRLRGLEFHARDARAIDPIELMRVDTLLACGQCFMYSDPLLALDYQSRHVRLAFDCGEPSRVAIAYLFEAGFVEFVHGDRARSEALQRRGEELGSRAGTPSFPVLFALAQSSRAMMRSDPDALAAAEHAVAVLRDSGMRASMEMGIVCDHQIIALYLRGELRRQAELAQELWQEAEQRGDGMMLTVLAKGVESTAWLVRGGAEDAERRLRRAREVWPTAEYDMTLFWFLIAEAWIAHYRADPRRSWAALERERDAVERSGLLRIPMNDAGLRIARGATAAWLARLGASVDGRDAREWLRIAERDERVLTRAGDKVGDARQMALPLRAALAFARKDRAACERSLRELIAFFDTRPNLALAAAARRRLGQLIGGDEGAALYAAGDGALRAQAVVDPEAMTHRLLPGCHVD